MNETYRKTIDYYNDFAADYIARTATREEVGPFYEEIISLIKPKSKILDFGCRTGRDSQFFIEAGFDVTAYDASPAMCQTAKQNGCKKIVNKTFLELDAENEFDLVWAYASLLHSSTDDLPKIFELVHKALKPGGKFFITFKYGDFEGIRNARLFNDFTEEKFDKLLKDSGKFTLYKIWLTDDVRTKQNRTNKWLNAILLKND